MIMPQVIGKIGEIGKGRNWRSGMGEPDVALIDSLGDLHIAEIKPAGFECLVDGEKQLDIYIEQGNAEDEEQIAWRESQGIRHVQPMDSSTYTPPNFRKSIPEIGKVEIRTQWCKSGLLAYAVFLSGKEAVKTALIAAAIGFSLKLAKKAGTKALMCSACSYCHGVIYESSWRRG
jgi:hypothetical protein